MWTQYADNHHGVCLVLNKDNIISDFNAIKDNIFYPEAVEDVTYNDNTFIEGEAFTYKSVDYKCRLSPEENVVCNKHNLLLEKHLDYSGELETRFLYYSQNHKEFKFIPIRKSLVEIILGSDVPAIYREMISYYINKHYSNIRVVNVQYHGALNMSIASI